MSTVLVVVLMLVFGVGYVMYRGLQVKQLTEQGRTIEAEIIKKIKFSRQGMSHYRLVYQFSVDAMVYSGKCSLFESECRSLDVGDNISIVYLLTNPKINALQSMIDKAKKAKDAKNEN